MGSTNTFASRLQEVMSQSSNSFDDEFIKLFFASKPQPKESTDTNNNEDLDEKSDHVVVGSSSSSSSRGRNSSLSSDSSSSDSSSSDEDSDPIQNKENDLEYEELQKERAKIFGKIDSMAGQVLQESKSSSSKNVYPIQPKRTRRLTPYANSYTHTHYFVQQNQVVVQQKKTEFELFMDKVKLSPWSLTHPFEKLTRKISKMDSMDELDEEIV